MEINKEEENVNLSENSGKKKRKLGIFHKTILILVIFVVIIIIVLLGIGGNLAVNSVRESNVAEDVNIKVGELFDSYFDDTSWNAHNGDESVLSQFVYDEVTFSGYGISLERKNGHIVNLKKKQGSII